MKNRSNELENKQDRKGGNFLPALSNIVGIVAIVFVIAMLLPAFLPRVFGDQVYVVVSGSMEPEIPVGSLVIVKPAEPASVHEGDVIAFQSGNSVVTHRVVENQSAESQFITKGDANEVKDMNPVPYTNLLGVVSHHFAGIGNFFAFFSTLAGKAFLFVLIALGVILQILAGRLRQ